MNDPFQRLLLMAEPEALSLNSQAALGPVRPPQRSQFSHLVRHFLERFFNHETASPDGDAKGRLVLIGLTVGLPGLAVALYLWPVYHQFIRFRQAYPTYSVPPPYWVQVNHHFFYVVYSFVAMGIITVFEWDMFFPDGLDVFVLQTLPIPQSRVFFARVSAIAILIAGFLFNANVLAPLALPAAIDPPSLPRFLAGHLLAVAGSGLFAAVFILATQGVLIAVLGERLFRRISLLLQGLIITALLMLLLLFPVLSATVPIFLQSGRGYAVYFPPFWFLGVYQRFFEGPSALSIYAMLARTGWVALTLTAVLAALAYPLAYLRRVRQLVEGSTARYSRNWLTCPLDRILHAILVRSPIRRAVFHFISQTLLRVPRYRIYLVLYEGVGISIVVAAILRLTVVHQQVRMAVSADGIRSATGIAAFWIVGGLCMAFVSPGNRQGSWVFRTLHGKPPRFPVALALSLAAQQWILLWGTTVACGLWAVSRSFAPLALLTWRATVSQLLVTTAMCLLLTDIFFLNIKTVAFTGEPAREQPNFAITVLKYFAFIPLVAWVPIASEPSVEKSVGNMLLAVGAIVAAHLTLRSQHRRILREHCNLPGLEDDEEEFPMKLGLRY